MLQKAMLEEVRTKWRGGSEAFFAGGAVAEDEVVGLGVDAVPVEGYSHAFNVACAR